MSRPSTATAWSVAHSARAASGRQILVFVMVAFATLMAYVVVSLLILRRTSFQAGFFDLLRPGLGRGLTTLALALLFGVLFVLIVLVPLRLGSRIGIGDAGLRVRHVPATVIACLLVWPLFQLASLAVAAARGPVVSADAWQQRPVLDHIGQTIAPILINSGPEEIVYRAFVLGLCLEFFRRRRPTRVAVVAAVAVSMVAFALGHIPIALVEGRSVVAAMVGTLVGALAYALLYLLTRNVYLVAVVHGVGNASVGGDFTAVQNATVAEPGLFVVLVVVGLMASVPLWVAPWVARHRDPAIPPAASAGLSQRSGSSAGTVSRR